MTKEFNPNGTIKEEPENSKKENSDEEKSDEVSSANTGENDDIDDDIISNQLQELITLHDIDKEIDTQISFKKQNIIKSSIFGRKNLKK